MIINSYTEKLIAGLRNVPVFFPLGVEFLLKLTISRGSSVSFSVLLVSHILPESFYTLSQFLKIVSPGLS